MALSTADCLAAIEGHSSGLASAARGNLEARVEHCPDWSVADLVWHLTEVHWFWATIAGELLTEPPDESRRPGRPADAQLVDGFAAGAGRLVDVLRSADQGAHCWTWAPQQQDVAFVTRHQVQEAAVHHWDGGHAAGQRVEIDPAVAADAVEEFLTFSVSSEADPADPPRPALGGAIWLRASSTRDGSSPTWLITDGRSPGTTTWRVVATGADPTDVAGDVPTVGGDVDPDRVLLWLYGRVPTPWVDGRSGDGDAAVLDRFRALTFTD